MAILFVIDPADNVAVALEDVPVGEVAYSGAVSGTLRVGEPVPRGHKAALRQIAAGEPVVKHGHPIALATSEIPAGRWVHIHNAKSPSSPD